MDSFWAIISGRIFFFLKHQFAGYVRGLLAIDLWLVLWGWRSPDYFHPRKKQTIVGQGSQLTLRKKT
jgi:hypothetical protein